MGFKKRGAIYSVIALMLCVAVYLNVSYSRNNEDDLTAGANTTDTGNTIIGQSILVDSTTPAETVLGIEGAETSATDGDYFSAARLSRQKARDEAVSILNGTIENSNTTDDAKAVANTNIQLMAENAMVESRIENLIIAKGYKDCVVFVNDDSINVIVSKTDEGLSSADVARIKDIVLDETDAVADNVKIIETA